MPAQNESSMVSPSLSAHRTARVRLPPPQVTEHGEYVLLSLHWEPIGGSVVDGAAGKAETTKTVAEVCEHGH